MISRIIVYAVTYFTSFWLADTQLELRYIPSLYVAAFTTITVGHFVWLYLFAPVSDKEIRKHWKKKAKRARKMRQARAQMDADADAGATQAQAQAQAQEAKTR